MVVLILSVMAVRLGREASRASRAERDAEQKLFESSVAQARASRWSGRMGQRFRSLEALKEAASLARSLKLGRDELRDVRNQAIACLALADLRQTRQWPIETEHMNLNIDFDSSLELYTNVDANVTVRVRRIGSDVEVACIPAPRIKVDKGTPFFSPDGRFLAVNYSRDVRPVASLIWDITGAQTVREFAGPEQAAVLGFSPDCRCFAMSRADGSISLYVFGGDKVRQLLPGLKTDQIAFRPDGRQMACTGKGAGKVNILDVETGAILRSLPHSADCFILAWSPDGRLLAAGSDDRNIHLWDAWDWRRQAILEGHQLEIVSLVFSPDSHVLASSGSEGTTRLWDPISGTHLLSAAGRCVHFDQTGRTLAFRDGVRMGFWDVATGRECRQFRYGRVGNRMPRYSIASVEDLAFTRDGRLLVATGNDGVRFWDAAAGEEIGFLPIGRHETAFFDSPGTRLFTYGRTGLRRWPVAFKPGKTTTTVAIGPPENFADTTGGTDIFRAGRDREGNLLAITDAENRRVTVFDLAQSSRRNLSHDNWYVTSLDVSPDGRWLALDCWRLGLRVWDVAANRPLSPQPAQTDEIGVGVPAFSPDGRWLVASRQNDHRIWRVGNWDEAPISIPRENPGIEASYLAFTRDSRILAVLRTSDEIQLFDTATFTEIARLLAPDARFVERIRFSPDGTQLVAATQNRVILFWDLKALSDGLREIGVDSDLPSPSRDRTASAGQLRVALFPETIEAENLKLIDSENCLWEMRDTTPRGRGACSNDRELYGIAEKNGYLGLELDAPQTGRYALHIRFTKAPDCGLVEVSLDAKTLKQPFDSFSEQVVTSELQDYGTIMLEQGRHRIRFTAVGKNPRASHYHMAVDCLELVLDGQRK